MLVVPVSVNRRGSWLSWKWVRIELVGCGAINCDFTPWLQFHAIVVRSIIMHHNASWAQGQIHNANLSSPFHTISTVTWRKHGLRSLIASRRNNPRKSSTISTMLYNPLIWDNMNEKRRPKKLCLHFLGQVSYFFDRFLCWSCDSQFFAIPWTTILNNHSPGKGVWDSQLVRQLWLGLIVDT